MCLGSSDPAVVKSREINKQIKSEAKQMAREVKLLLLGMLCALDVQTKHSWTSFAYAWVKNRSRREWEIDHS